MVASGSNSSLALERLRALMREHRDEPGYRLPPEREIAAMLSVGRRAVRRALEVLEAEGTVWRQQGKGTFAGQRPLQRADLSALAIVTNPAEVMETRILIEPGLARLAALRASREDIDALHRLARKVVTASDDDGWEVWDSALHRRIAQAAGNQMLLSILDAVQKVRKEGEWRHLRASVRTAERRERVFVQHDEIVSAIARRDGAEAERAMHRHLTTIETQLRALIIGTDASSGAPDASTEGKADATMQRIAS